MTKIPVLGVGIDVLEISRMEKIICREYFLRRVFTDEEQLYIASKKSGSAATAAGIFAAKEAFFKACGDGISLAGLKEAGISRLSGGKPYFKLTGTLERRFSDKRIDLSITHSGTVAAAVVVISDSHADCIYEH